MASFSLVSTEYPNSSSTIFSIVETFFGLGMIAGPIIGGLLYEVGGFKLPFFSLGGILVAMGIATYSCMRAVQEKEVDTDHQRGLSDLLGLDQVFMGFQGLFGSCYTLGFIMTAAERNLHDYSLTAGHLGEQAA